MTLLLADATVVVHFLFIVFVCTGGLLALRYAWIPWIHLPATLWGVTVELLGWHCPLTPLENWLRASGGQEAYQGDFIARYLLPIIYPTGLTRTGQMIFGCLLVLLNIGIYWFVWQHRKTPNRFGNV